LIYYAYGHHSFCKVNILNPYPYIKFKNLMRIFQPKFTPNSNIRNIFEGKAQKHLMHFYGKLSLFLSHLSIYFHFCCVIAKVNVLLTSPVSIPSIYFPFPFPFLLQYIFYGSKSKFPPKKYFQNGKSPFFLYENFLNILLKLKEIFNKIDDRFYQK
jgi:hypothetical protein